jgi:hypothetical protein
VVVLGLGLIVAGLLCLFGFVGAAARADRRQWDADPSRIAPLTRRPRQLLVAAVGLVAVGVLLLLVHVVGLWL